MDKQQFLDLVGLSIFTSEILGKTADKIHTHTKSQITDFPTSMPASDVKSWAKAAAKPTYTPTEVGVIGTAPASGQIAVFDGTTGKIKSTGFTIATSVPSGAKFTDTIYSHPTYTARSSGLYKITVDGTGHISGVTAVTKSDITALGIPGQDTNTTYGLTSASTNGLLSSGDFVKISKFTAAEAGYLSGVTSAIQTQLNGKAPSSHGTHVTYGTKTTALVSGGTGAIGTSSALSREDHTHTLPAYPTALRNPNALTISLNGTSQSSYDGSAAKSINITPASIGASPTSHTHTTINALYTSNGGAQPPSYVASGTVRFNMMDEFKGLGAFHYMDCILMDTYTGSDVPYVTALGITKTATPEAYIAVGDKGNTTTWKAQARLLTNLNYKAYCTPANIGALASGGTAVNASKVTNSIIVKLNGGTTEGSNMFTFNGSAAKTLNITAASIGAAAASHGTHVSYGSSTTALTSGGTGAVGSATTLSRSDHTHTLPAYPTALRCPTALTFTGATTGTWDGSAAETVNIPTIPGSLKNPYALTINGTVYDGASAKSINITVDSIGASAYNHQHRTLKSNTDNRDVDTKPDDYNSVFNVVGLKSNSVIGITNGDNYSGVLGMRGWADKSGGQAHELALTGNGKLFHRHGGDTAWGPWYQIYTSEFKPPLPDLLNCMRMYGGTVLDSKGTTTDANAQYKAIALSTATANTSAFSKVLTDLPKGKYSVMIRMKMSAITSTANIIKIQCGDTSALKTFYVRPNMFTTANVYQTFGFTVEHTTTSFTANLTIGTALAGATVTVDYLAIAPTFTAISSVA